MNNDILNDIYNEEYNDFINNFIKNKLLEEPSLIEEYKILEIEYDIDGKKKDIYKLASERDIKKIQIESDKNELDYKFSQNLITKENYEENVKDINIKLKEQNLLYDDLIFDIINTSDINTIKESIIKYNLNSIDLSRLAGAIKSVSENKIDEFRSNNNNFMLDKLSYWNYKYNKISKGISKAREVESFILSIIEEK